MGQALVHYLRRYGALIRREQPTKWRRCCLDCIPEVDQRVAPLLGFR